MHFIRFNTTNSNLHIKHGVVMKEKKSTYMGGEMDEQRIIIPKQIEKFFNKRILFLILLIILLLLIPLLV